MTPATKLNALVVDAARQAAINDAAQPGAGTGGSSATDAARNQANTACQSTGSTGAAGLGVSLIEDGARSATRGDALVIEGAKTAVRDSGDHVNPDGTVTAVPGTTGQSVQSPFSGLADPNIAKGVKGDVSNRQMLMDAATCELGDKEACARNNRANAQKPAGDNKGSTPTDDPNLVCHPGNNSTRYNDDRRSNHDDHHRHQDKLCQGWQADRAGHDHRPSV